MKFTITGLWAIRDKKVGWYPSFIDEYFKVHYDSTDIDSFSTLKL